MDWTTFTTFWAPIVDAVGSIATAVALFFAWWQIGVAKRQAQAQFEDELAKEYRNIAMRLPIKVLLGEPLYGKDYQAALDDLYHYIDLTNEQIFLRQQNRVSKATWKNWRDGIKANLARPAFNRAWIEIKQRSNGSFQELRRLEASNFCDDPRRWWWRDAKFFR